MPSLRSSGKILGSSVSIRQLAKEHNLSSPVSLRGLLKALGVRGSPKSCLSLARIICRSFDPATKSANFTDGVPDFETFRQTFGTGEIAFELTPFVGHPILTTAFFLFYKHFLKGTANGGLATGFCTSLASLVADNFWTGRTDTHTITKASVHRS